MNTWASPALRRRILLISIQLFALLGTGFQAFQNGCIRYHQGDLTYYYTASSALLAGRMPYRDFQLAYPPLSLLPFLLPHLVSVGKTFRLNLYMHLFLVESVVWSTIIAVLLARMTTRWKFRFNSEMALIVYALIVLIFSALLPWRYDLFPTLLTFAAFYCLLQNRPLAAGIWLGLATAAKLYPIVLLPMFGLYLLAQSRRRDTFQLGLGCFGAMAACLLPFARVPAPALFQFLTFHQHRGLEVESLGAGAIMVARALGWTHAHVVINYGAFHLSSPSAPAIIHCLPAIFLVIYGLTLAGGWSAFRRDMARNGEIAPETIARFVVAALLAFIAANKVFSTSYVIWLLPFAPLLRPREAIQMVILFALTIAIYPYNFHEILDMRPAGILLLNGRNVFLLALLFQLARPLNEAPLCLRPIFSWLRSFGVPSAPAASFTAKSKAQPRL